MTDYAGHWQTLLKEKGTESVDLIASLTEAAVNEFLAKHFALDKIHYQKEIKKTFNDGTQLRERRAAGGELGHRSGDPDDVAQRDVGAGCALEDEEPFARRRIRIGVTILLLQVEALELITALVVADDHSLDRDDRSADRAGGAAALHLADRGGRAGAPGSRSPSGAGARAGRSNPR